MATIRYACTHCGRKFESEEKDTVECPGCFWSTSVKRADEPEAPSSQSSQPSQSVPKMPFFSFPKVTIKVVSFVIIGLIVLAAFFWALPRWKALIPSRVSSPVVEIPVSTQPVLSLWDRLTPEEKTALEPVTDPQKEK